MLRILLPIYKENNKEIDKRYESFTTNLASRLTLSDVLITIREGRFIREETDKTSILIILSYGECISYVIKPYSRLVLTKTKAKLYWENILIKKFTGQSIKRAYDSEYERLRNDLAR